MTPARPVRRGGTVPFHRPQAEARLPDARMSAHGPGHHKGAWAAAIVLAAIFIPAGLTKLAGLASIRDMFQAWGYDLWFLYLIGALELIAGILLLVPRWATYAAAYLTIQMLGALATHIVNAEWLVALVPIAVGLVAMYLMWARLPDTADAAGRPRPSPERP